MNLHAQFINIPLDTSVIDFLGSAATKAAYRVGHRDARHAASELALKYEMYIEKLEENLGDFDCQISATELIGSLRKECGL